MAGAETVHPVDQAETVHPVDQAEDVTPPTQVADYAAAIPASDEPTRRKSGKELRQALDMRLGVSVRSYRRFLDLMMKEAYEGKRPVSDPQKMAVAVKTSVELFLAEKMLARGGGDTEEEHLLGPDGGFQPGKAGTFRKKTAKARTGLDRYGARVDEQTVTIEGGEADPTIEMDAEAEIL